MRVKLSKDWRRWTKGKVLAGAAAREALADKAGSTVKATKTEEASQDVKPS
jgi:hypothetical protein